MQYSRAVETDRLTKRYRSTAIINNLTLNISRGEVVGIIGPNGAGKSSLLRLIIGAIRPTAGQIWVLGREIGDHYLRTRIGYLPEGCPLQEFLTAGEMLSLHASLAGISRGESSPHVIAQLDRLGVSCGSRIKEMSRGMRQRLGIAMATFHTPLHTPDLVILDEPTAALDQSGRAIVQEIVRDLAETGRTVLVSSHLLTEIERECSRIIFLNHGEVVADKSAAELTAFTSRIDIEVTGMNDRAMKAIERISARIEYDLTTPSQIKAFVRDKIDSSAIAAALVQNGVGLIALVPQTETLEDLFVRLTSSSP